MRCAKARDLFSSYLEGEMDVAASLLFEQHLAECPKCKAEYDRFNAAVMMLDEMPEVDPPANFHASVMARVEQARGAAPSPVRWWQIDWQHVFTIRVPARAAAFVAAALVMVGVLVQVTPVGTGVMNLLGLQKASDTLVTETQTATAPPWQLKSGDAVYDMSGSGLLISVTSRVDASPRTYALRLQARSDEPVAFTVRAGSDKYAGLVVRNQDSTIRVSVPASKELVTAQVKWHYKGESYSQSVYLPQNFNPGAHAKRLSMRFDNMAVGDLLSSIARQYGVVILASGDMEKIVPLAVVQSSSPSEALYCSVENPDVNMKQRVLAPSIYIVEPVK